MTRIAICLCLLGVGGTAAAERTYQYCQPLLAKYEMECTEQSAPRDDTREALCAAYKRQIEEDCGAMGSDDADENADAEDPPAE